MPLENRHHLRAVAGNHDLRLLLAAGLVSQTGDWILGTGIAFQAYAISGSTVVSALVLLATQAPQVVVGPIAGVVADRVDRRRLMIGVNLALALLVVPLATVRDASQVWLVILVVAVTSCLTPFFVVAEAALLPAVVPPAHLVTANAVNAQVRNVSRLVGAAFGGVLVGVGGLLWLALADAATFLIAAALLAWLQYRRTSPERTADLHPVRDALEGLASLRGSRTLLVVLAFFATSGIGEGAMGTLFAPFVQDELGGTGGAFGTILAAQAVGGIVGGLVVTAIGHRVPPRALFAGGAVVFGLGDLALFLSPLVGGGVVPAVVIIALVGLPGAALFAGVLVLFQTGTEDRLRGRVFGALTAVQNLTMLLGTAAAGGLAGSLGILPVISVQGAGYVVVGLVAALVLRRMPDAERDGARAASTEDPTGPGVPHDAGERPGRLDNWAVSTRIPSVALASNVRTDSFSDPLALRALAHPLRLELRGLIGREGSLTAAEAARQLGISHALASHHLRQLAKYGFIEPAEASDNRARPWRVSSTSLEVEPRDADARATADLLDRHLAEQAPLRLAEWQERRGELDPAWTDVAGVRGGLLYLTPAELDELMTAYRATVARLAERRPVGHAEARPADAEPVSVTLVAVPIERTERGG